jgi:hypothetical protein
MIAKSDMDIIGIKERGGDAYHLRVRSLLGRWFDYRKSSYGRIQANTDSPKTTNKEISK